MPDRASNNVPPAIKKIWHEQEKLRWKYGNLKNKDNTTEEEMTSTTRAIVAHDTLNNGGWKMEEVHLRKLEEGELLVEMVATGVCHTDLLCGNLPGGSSPIAFYPRVLGHEGSGYVRDIGPGVSVAQPGDPVLCSFAFCNECSICKDGHHSVCSNFMALNFAPPPQNTFQLASKSGEPEIGGSFFGQSSFANYSIVKQCSIVNVKGTVQDKKELQMFAPLGCAMQTGSGTVINASGATEKDTICIMGLGGVGLAAVMGAKIRGCRKIIGIDRVEKRLKLAQELGCTHVIDGGRLGEGKELGDVVKEVADGVGPHITIDTTGVPVLMDAGMKFTRNHGKYIQVGSAPFDYTLKNVVSFEFMCAGKQWIGEIEGGAYPPEYVPKMIQWYREGKFPIDKMIKLTPAEDFLKALEGMHTGETIKPILTWS